MRAADASIPPTLTWSSSLSSCASNLTMTTSSSSSDSVSTFKPPPMSALKIQSRVPLALQAVFLESCRTGTVCSPPPANGVASKTFPRVGSCPSFRGGGGGGDDNSCKESACHSSQTRHRHVAFAFQKSVSFDKAVAFDSELDIAPRRRQTMNRWGSSSARDVTSSPPKMPHNPSFRRWDDRGDLGLSTIVKVAEPDSNATSRWKCEPSREGSSCLRSPPRRPSRHHTRSSAA